MKYCTRCGTQLVDEAVVCTGCGCAVETIPAKKGNSKLANIAKIFMIIGCVLTGFSLIPLCWTIPMTLYYCNAIKNNEKVGIGFKICSFLFVSNIAGIFMFCDND